MSEPLRVTITSGPDALRRSFGHLDFDAIGPVFIDAATGQRYEWPWAESQVIFEDQPRRGVDRNMLAGAPLLGLLLRRKQFRVAISRQGATVVFNAAGDAMARDRMARRIVETWPAAIGHLFVGAAAMQ